MKRIVLFCSVGFSTSLLVAKMQAAADALKFECDISAHSVANAPELVPDADIVLIGPQVRFEQKRLQKEFPDKIIECIDMRMYGTMDGAAVLNYVIHRLRL